ncbi:MAG: AEC family transporter [Alphaproteobacteria bacterium]|nr:AEC family transporter [Alphaproteobacteria bacterium]
MYSELAAILIPIFFTVAVGYGWERIGVDFPTEFVTRSTVYVLTPCLVFATMTGLDVSLAAYGQVALATVGVLAVVATVGIVGLRLRGLSLRAFLPPILIPNSGNLGLPLGLFAFGETGLALAIASYTIYALVQYTVCQLIAAGRASFKIVVRQPLIYAAAISLVFLGTDTTPPEWALNTTTLIGGAAIPLNLLALGVALARLKVSSLQNSLFVSVLRLGVGLLAALAITEALDLDPVTRGVVILQSAGPAALFSYLWAQLYGNSAEQVAGVIMISTLISLATLPLLLLVVL